MHTGSHKLNNALGQCLLAKRMGKPRIIAETGAGQHGVATATACALLGMECVVYMGTEDMRRQRPNVRADAPARRDRQRRRRRLAHAQGGRLGGDPRLGRERRRHALRDRLLRRPGAVPGARARPPARDRRRGARAGARAVRPAAGARDRVRRRRLERDRHVHPVRRRRRGRAGRRRGGGGGARDAGATARRCRSAAAAACCTAPTRRSCRTRRARSPRRTRSRPASTTPASGRSTPGCATPAARATRRSPTSRRSRRSRRLAELEGIIPALESSHAVAWVLANAPAGVTAHRPDLPLGPRRQGPRRGAGAQRRERRRPARTRSPRRSPPLPAGRR